ncbi:MAG TPA: hypothetical protein VJ550_00240 [Geomonas sp.]|nr:hypothetical protein [Geomonas sp.]
MKGFGLMILGILALLPLGLAGCGGSGSNGSTSDPFANASQGTSTTAGTPTPSGSGTVLGYTMSLSTASSSGATTVGANSTVIATATLKDNLGNSVALQPVKFEEVATAATPASVAIAATVVATSSEGKATTFLTTVDSSINRDVIIKASTSVNGQEVSALSIFKMVRSTGNYIEFITTKNITDPDGNLNSIKVTVVEADPVQTPYFGFLQLVTLDVLDNNGVKRTGVPVNLEVINVIGPCTVFLGSEGSTTQTVTTDNTGLAVFSADVVMKTPPPGSQQACSVVYRATTPDPNGGPDLFSYGAYLVSLINTI